MQQPPVMIPTVPSVSAATITTEQIQKYLDENKKLISAIMENQNLGKLAECAQYQALLQKNLMYLAAIADAQPQTSSVPPQVGSHPNISPGGFYMQQHPQSAPPIGQQQQAGVFHPRMPLHFNSLPYQSHEQHQQQQVMQGQMGHNQSGGLNNSGATPPPTVSTVQKERNAMELGSSNADGRGTLGGGGGVRPRVSEG